MASWIRAALMFAVGSVLGSAAGCAVGALYANRGPTYELAEDVPLRHGGGTAPPIAVLHAGQQFDVFMRKGDINYIRVYAITYDRDLAGHTLRVATRTRTADAPWDRPPASVPSPEAHP